MNALRLQHMALLICLIASVLLTSSSNAQNSFRRKNENRANTAQQEQLQSLRNQSSQQFNSVPSRTAKPGMGFASNSFKSQFDTVVRKHYEDNRLPGVVVLMGRDGMLVYKKSIGFSDISGRKRVSEHNIFRLASVSKWVAALMTLKLEEQGKIALDTKAKTYLNGLPSHHDSTLKQMLSCRAGIRHYGESTSPLSPAGWSKTIYTNACATAPNMWNDPLAQSIGDYHYSTHSYIPLAACLESATGKSTPQLLRQLISDPLGLSSLRMENLETNLSQRVKLYTDVDSEDVSKGNRSVSRDNLTWKFLGGGMESTPLDLLKLGMNVCDKKVISNANLERMMKRFEWDKSYTLGCNTVVENGNRVIAKSGGQTGVSSYIWMVPEKRMVMVVLTNRQSGNAPKLGKRLRNIALGTTSAKDKKPDLVVDQFQLRGTPVFKNGNLEIPLKFRVTNNGLAGISSNFVNGIQLGTKYRWTGFTQNLLGKGGNTTINATVKIPDPSRLHKGRTLNLTVTADARIAAADTSIASYARVNETNETNNTRTLKVKIPGGVGGFSNGQSQPQAHPTASKDRPKTRAGASKPKRAGAAKAKRAGTTKAKRTGSGKATANKRTKTGKAKNNKKEDRDRRRRRKDK